MWTQVGAGALAVGHPVTLTYDNGEGLQFRRTIAVDDKYLFTVKDEVANKSANPVTLFPYALISRHGTPKTLGYYILHEGLIGVLGNDGLQEYTYKKIERKRTSISTSPTAGSASPTNTGRRRWCPTPTRTSRRISPPARSAPDDLSDRLSARCENHRAGRHRLGRRAAVRRRQGSGGHQRLREAAEPQPLRPADRLGLVLLHHQAAVHRHRLFLPPGRQFRPRHSHRHRADQGGVLPARQQVLCLDGEDEGGAAADDRRCASAIPTTRPSSSKS